MSLSDALELKAQEKHLYEEARMLCAKKRFAQHFLVDPTVVTKIMAIVQPSTDETIVEIGPGSGVLTDAFLEKAGKIMGIELEHRMVSHLKKKFRETANFQLLEEDILKVDFNTWDLPSYKVVGNLPYNIATPILFHLAGELACSDYPTRKRMVQATLMVQKEVGERITASPGSKAYNPLSIAIQYWFTAKLNHLVPPSAFLPPPKVTSAIITLSPLSAPRVPVKDLAVFQRLIRTAFQQRRKTLKNALSTFGPSAQIDQMFSLVESDVGPIRTQRAETISIETFGALADAYVAYAR